ncbi:MAG: type II toxin-antitoxin system RatA family toxin [Rickettsiales bacterium]|nr:type II toxin-antitoxin system RatA family toxin [Rickettsiales bacterium]
MHTHHEVKQCPYTIHQLFDLVMDIEKYPEFVHWCRAARINSRHNEYVTADLVIKFKAFQEQYSSKVTYSLPDEASTECWIIAELIEGPFSHMKTVWNFKKLDDIHSEIDFHIEFKFNNRILDRVIGVVFEMAQRKLMSAFMDRARSLYLQPK